MSRQIKIGSTILWDTADAGRHWSPKYGMLKRAMVEVKAPQGTGYWLKPAGVEAATHTVDVVYLVANAATATALKRILEAAQFVGVSTLTLPNGKTIGNCRLSDVAEFAEQYTPDGYKVSTTLTFTEYP